MATQQFRKIEKQQRESYIRKILTKEPSTFPPPRIYQCPFQTQGSFTYGTFKLNYYSRQNSKNPKAIIVQFHGMSSHGGTSGYFSKVITTQNKNINFYALDQLNFGQSEGPYRGLVSTLQESAVCGNSFIDFLLQKFEQKPKIFLSGSSYGGTIIFKMILARPQAYQGAIFLNPALRNIPTNYYLNKFGQFLGWLTPKLKIPVPFSNKSTKFNSYQLIKNDPYFYHGGLVLGSVNNVLNGVDQISRQYSNLKISFIVFQGGVDKLVDLFAPLDLEEQSPSNDKTILYFENLWHSIFNEEEIDQISIVASQWLSKRINGTFFNTK